VAAVVAAAVAAAAAAAAEVAGGADRVAIDIKGTAERDGMRRAGLLAAACLKMIEPYIKPGVSTAELNKISHEFTLSHGGIPAPLNYRGFPKSICTSINDVVCHGIPSTKDVLRDGDIVNVDVTPILDGFHGDTSATFFVGKVAEQARHVTEVARKSLQLGIAAVRPDGRIRDIGAAIEDYAHAEGCSVVRDYCGHGIGRIFHTDPQVPHYRARGPNPRLRPGMTFTVEPMINVGTWQTRLMRDGWTVRTRDGKLSAQFEHTLLVTEDGVEILTDPGKLAGSEFEV